MTFGKIATQHHFLKHNHRKSNSSIPG